MGKHRTFKANKFLLDHLHGQKGAAVGQPPQLMDRRNAGML
jgi:hypothetical protein